MYTQPSLHPSVDAMQDLLVDFLPIPQLFLIQALVLEDWRVVDVQLALLLRPLGVVRYCPYSHLLFSLGFG